MEKRLWNAKEIAKVRRAADVLVLLPMAFFLMGLSFFFYDGDPRLGKLPSWRFLIPFLTGAGMDFFVHLRLAGLPAFPYQKLRNRACELFVVTQGWCLALLGWFGVFFYGGLDADRLCIPPVALKLLWGLFFLLFAEALAGLERSRFLRVSLAGFLAGFFGGILLAYILMEPTFFLAGIYFSAFCLTILLPLAISRSLHRLADRQEAELASGHLQSRGEEQSVMEMEKTERIRLSELTSSEIRGMKCVSLGSVFLLASLNCFIGGALAFFSAWELEYSRMLLCWGTAGAYLLLLAGACLFCAAPHRLGMKCWAVVLLGGILGIAAVGIGLAVAGNRVSDELLFAGGVMLFLGLFTVFAAMFLNAVQKTAGRDEAVLYEKLRAKFVFSSVAALMFFLIALGVMKVGVPLAMIVFLIWGCFTLGIFWNGRDVVLRFLDSEAET